MNLANKLTILRIILVPVFMIFLLSDIKYSDYIALFVFVFAAITDSVDGHVARSRGEITKFGKFMDPLADKLLVTAALVLLVELGKVPGWITFVIIAREFAITGLRVLAASENITIAASMWGKVKTITQMVAIVSLLMNNFPFNYIDFPFDQIMLIIATIFTVISGVDYLYKNRKVFSNM